MYALMMYPYLRCAALVLVSAVAANNFMEEDEFCEYLNREHDANQTLVVGCATNENITCPELNSSDPNTADDENNVIDDVRLLCREFDSLTFIWNNTATDSTVCGGMVIVAELISCDSPEAVYLIKKTNTSTVRFDGLQANTSYATRFWTLVDGTARRVTNTPVSWTIDNGNLKREPVRELRITNGFELVNNDLVQTSFGWKLSENMACHYKIIYFPNRLELPTVFQVDLGESYGDIRLSDLTMATLYTVSVGSYNAEKAKFKFSTPTCMEMKKNFSLCRPQDPYDVILTEMAQTGAGRYNVMVTWKSPNTGGQGVDYFTVKAKNESKNVSATASVAYFDDVLTEDELYYASVQAFSGLGPSKEVTVWYTRAVLADGDDHRHPLLWLAVAFTVVASCTVALVVGYKYIYWRTKSKTAAAAVAAAAAAAADAAEAAAVASETSGDTSSFDLVLLKYLRDNGDLLLDHKNVIVSDVILGHGHFGVVRKGSVKTDGDGEYPVAVKSLRDYPTSRDLEEFLGEIVLMQKVGQHPNIVSMIGCCLDANRQCMLVVEYCPLGDLQTYLRKVNIKSWYANDFYVGQKTAVDKKDVPVDVGNNSSSRPPMVFNNCYLYHGDENIFLTVDDLMRYASQTANGMAFLEKNRIVHRDLAARNVLLSDHQTVKICDFGLSRDVYEQNHYLKSTRGDPLPVKWMALESLKYRVYTTQSDVWSFGVLFWEIMMLGGCPYPMISSSKLYDVLDRGYRMPRPTLCCYSLYQLMLACWHSNPASRPKFSSIKDTIDGIMANQYS